MFFNSRFKFHKSLTIPNPLKFYANMIKNPKNWTSINMEKLFNKHAIIFKLTGNLVSSGIIDVIQLSMRIFCLRWEQALVSKIRTMNIY